VIVVVPSLAHSDAEKSLVKVSKPVSLTMRSAIGVVSVPTTSGVRQRRRQALLFVGQRHGGVETAGDGRQRRRRRVVVVVAATACGQHG